MIIIISSELCLFFRGAIYVGRVLESEATVYNCRMVDIRPKQRGQCGGNATKKMRFNLKP